MRPFFSVQCLKLSKKRVVLFPKIVFGVIYYKFVDDGTDLGVVYSIEIHDILSTDTRIVFRDAVK